LRLLVRRAQRFESRQVLPRGWAARSLRALNVLRASLSTGRNGRGGGTTAPRRRAASAAATPTACSSLRLRFVATRRPPRIRRLRHTFTAFCCTSNTRTPEGPCSARDILIAAMKSLNLFRRLTAFRFLYCDRF
jgi:hypothetical protein